MQGFRCDSGKNTPVTGIQDTTDHRIFAGLRGGGCGKTVDTMHKIPLTPRLKNNVNNEMSHLISN